MSTPRRTHGTPPLLDVDALLANLADVEPEDEWSGAILAHAADTDDWTPARRDPVAW